MNMFPIFVLALISSIASATPLFPRQPTTTSPFVVRAFQPGSPFHLSSLNASHGHFWFGKTTTSSCPTDSNPNCPIGTETTLVVSGDGSAKLVRTNPSIRMDRYLAPLPSFCTSLTSLHGIQDATVPGGQTIYVAKDGALSYTPAHEANVVSLAYPSGFAYSTGSSETGNGNGGPDYFTFSGTPSKGWLACPSTAKAKAKKGGPWQVYAYIREAVNQGCVEFEATGEPYVGGAVWQYD